jgi:hypothetical protein
LRLEGEQLFGTTSLNQVMFPLRDGISALAEIGVSKSRDPEHSCNMTVTSIGCELGKSYQPVSNSERGIPVKLFAGQAVSRPRLQS